MNDIANGKVSTGWDVHTVQFVFVCVCNVVWWRGETHQYPNISTHPLRFDTPKEEQKDKGMTEKKTNDYPLDLNIPKD